MDSSFFLLFWVGQYVCCSITCTVSATNILNARYPGVTLVELSGIKKKKGHLLRKRPVPTEEPEVDIRQG
jgi:hypothetical protein